jgi:hypothetical protein
LAGATRLGTKGRPVDFGIASPVGQRFVGDARRPCPFAGGPPHPLVPSSNTRKHLEATTDRVPFTMPGRREVAGFLVLLNGATEPVSEPTPCVYDWFRGVERAEFRLRSRHRISVPRGIEATTVAITRADGAILWAHPIQRDSAVGQEINLDPDPTQPEVIPGHEQPTEWDGR